MVFRWERNHFAFSDLRGRYLAFGQRQPSGRRGGEDHKLSFDSHNPKHLNNEKVIRSSGKLGDSKETNHEHCVALINVGFKVPEGAFNLVAILPSVDRDSNPPDRLL